MDNNIFLADMEPIKFEDYLQYNGEGRGNLGEEIPIVVYRLLEYSVKAELVQRYGRDVQIDVFRQAGRRAGNYFASHLLDMTLPMDRFLGQLQTKLQELKIGILRVEEVDEATGRITLTVAEDADCSGLPVLGETVCNFDEGFISGILSTYSGKEYRAVEVDCWATGDRVCRFKAEIYD